MNSVAALALVLPAFAAAGMLFRIRLRRRKPAADAPQPIETQLAALEQRLSERITDMDWRHASVLDRISATTDSLQSDIDWLTGERMIEQAISLARRGEDPEAICAETGMEMDEVQAIVRLRRH